MTDANSPKGPKISRERTPDQWIIRVLAAYRRVEVTQGSSTFTQKST
jgi:hypothetical protein